MADCVIADVPCSGLGVIRKKPDIRYKDKSKLSALPKIQLDILKNAADYVKPGGVLIYSTCTVRSCENAGVVENFLKTTLGFTTEEFSLPEGFPDSFNGMVTFWPHLHDTDGFFVCKLRKSQK